MSDNYTRVRRILRLILLANLSVAVLKIIAGQIIRSSSMTADGFHSITDGSSNLIGLIGIRLASKPIDKEHPYGHGKFENLAGLVIAGILLLLTGRIVITAINRFIVPVTPAVTTESIIVLIITIFINIIVSISEYKKGKSLNSSILISDSIHTRADIFISTGVLLALLGIRFGLPPVIDPAVSLVVALFVLLAAIEVYRETSGALLDRAVVDTDRLMEIVMRFDGVKDTHKIRSRGNANNLYIDMHIMTDPDMSVEDSHNLIHDIEKKIQDEINKDAQVIIHIEPYNQSAPD